MRQRVTPRPAVCVGANTLDEISCTTNLSLLSTDVKRRCRRLGALCYPLCLKTFWPEDGRKISRRNKRRLNELQGIESCRNPDLGALTFCWRRVWLIFLWAEDVGVVVGQYVKTWHRFFTITSRGVPARGAKAEMVGFLYFWDLTFFQITAKFQIKFMLKIILKLIRRANY